MNGLIMYKNRIWLSTGSDMKQKIPRAFHDSPMTRHQGYFKTHRQVRERFAWKGLKMDVLQHVRECAVCQ